MTTEITPRGDHAIAQAGPLPDLRPQLRVERLLTDLGRVDWRKVLIDTRPTSTISSGRHERFSACVRTSLMPPSQNS